MTNSLIQEPQEELLNAIRNGQQAVVEMVKTWVETVKSATPKVPSLQLPLADRLPKPEEVVSGAYDFAEKLLASQREFAGELFKATAPLLPGHGSGAQDGAAAQ
jgi:hypothetical protein